MFFIKETKMKKVLFLLTLGTLFSSIYAINDGQEKLPLLAATAAEEDATGRPPAQDLDAPGQWDLVDNTDYDSDDEADEPEKTQSSDGSVASSETTTYEDRPEFQELSPEHKDSAWAGEDLGHVELGVRQSDASAAAAAPRSPAVVRNLGGYYSRIIDIDGTKYMGADQSNSLYYIPQFKLTPAPHGTTASGYYERIVDIDGTKYLGVDMHGQLYYNPNLQLYLAQ